MNRRNAIAAGVAGLSALALTQAGAAETTQVDKSELENIKKLLQAHDDAISKLQLHLKKPLESDVRELDDEFVLKGVTEVYVPVFEARLVGPKKKVGIIRIDAVRKKIL